MNTNPKNSRIHTMSNARFILMMLVMVIVWALAFPFIKIGLEDLSYINLTIMRFFIVCLVLLVIFLLKSKWFDKLHKKDILPLFLLGFFGVMVYHIGLNYGEQLISPGAASLIIATIPVYIVILSVIFLKEKLNLIGLIGIFLSLIGVLIISIRGTESATIEITYLSAAFAVFIAAIMGALYTIAGKKMLERYNGFSLTIYAIVLGSIGLIPFVILSSLGSLEFAGQPLIEEVSSMRSETWIAIIFLGACSTVIGYIIWYVALQIKTATEISVYLYLVPVFSTLISFFIFDDKITVYYIFGGILVIIGLYIVNQNNKKLNRKKIN